MPEFDIVSPTRRREIRDIGRGYFFKESNGRVHTVNCKWTRGYSWAGRVFLRDETDARDFLKGKSWQNCSFCGGVPFRPGDLPPKDDEPTPGEDQEAPRPAMISVGNIQPIGLGWSVSAIENEIRREIDICMEHEAYRACIVMCATLVESILSRECKRLDLEMQLQSGEPPTLGARIKALRSFLKARAHKAATDLNFLRNTVVHANEPEDEMIDRDDAEVALAHLKRFIGNPLKKPPMSLSHKPLIVK